ncbi:MAG TPA: hypothetical protein VMR08_00700 [Patescibacteria group bacterium]|jgi:hypothetical protein|nr:hypothetical protein [Patescibacteria group bacterium]
MVKFSKRQSIEPHKGDKRYIRRIIKGLPGAGRFVSSVSEHRSLSADDRIKAKHIAKPGEGDRGDEHRKR